MNEIPRNVRVKGSGTAKSLGVLQTNSDAFKICHGILQRVKLMPFFVGFTFSSTPALPIQPEDIPRCGVYFMTERMGPDGDANHGEPRFIHTVTVGFSVWIQNNDPDDIDNKLDRAFMAVLNGLMTDSTLYNNDAWMLESYQGGQRAHHYGTLGSNNEMPIAELRFDLNFNFRTYWPPVVLDRLDTIHVDIEPNGMTDEVQDITWEYDFPQN